MGKAKTGSVRVAALMVPALDTKKPPKQQCRIEGTIFVPKNAPLAEGGVTLRQDFGLRAILHAYPPAKPYLVRLRFL